jgi:signal transduction histidine kinase
MPTAGRDDEMLGRVRGKVGDLVWRIPIRLRLTLAFAAAMGLVLSAMGLFLCLRLGAELDHSVAAGLRDRTDDVAVLARRPTPWLPAGPRDYLPEGTTFAQVLDGRGAVLYATPSLGERFRLGRARLDKVARAGGSTAAPGQVVFGRVIFDRIHVPGADDPFKVMVSPAGASTGRLILVGASLEPRAEALGGLRTQLLLGGPLVLLLSSLVAYGVATAALRPVEAMRRGAAAVSAADPGRRLTPPPARDEIARLGRTLNDMLGRLEAAVARERRFVSDASHELRTPLALLRGELELALRRKRTPDELERALRSAADETDRLCQLAADLLVLARADQGTLPVRMERLVAADLLDDLRRRFAARAAGANRQIEVAADPDLEFTADRLRVEQAMANLVDNGLRHGDGRLLLRARRRDGHIELHVQDAGAGFGDDILKRAFEPFSRGERTRSAPGSGLGLAIVDLVARAHGGSAHVANAPPGADVWLSLPAS